MSEVKCMNPWDPQSKRQYRIDGVYATLNAGQSQGGQAHGICYCIEGNTVDRASAKNGKGFCEDVSPTLNTQDRHAVVYAIEGNGIRPSHMGKGFSEDGKMYTLNTIEQHGVCYTVDCRNMNVNKEKSGTLQAKNGGGHSLNFLNPVLIENIDKHRILSMMEREISMMVTENKANTLTSTDYKGAQVICHEVLYD